MTFVNENNEKFRIHMQPITDTDFLEGLKLFSKILHTSIGPKASLKIVESEGGIAKLTTSSKRLIDWIEIDSPILQIIQNAMKGQLKMCSDFGLYTGLVSTSLLLNAFSYNLSYSTATKLIKFIGSVCISLINSLNIQVKVDFSSFQNLHQVVETVISSKPLCSSTTLTDVTALTACVVKAFVRGYSEKNETLGKVSVLIEKGAIGNSPSIFSGVLYPAPEISSERKWSRPKVNRKEKRNILVALFAVSLSTANQNGKTAEEDLDFAEGCREIQEQILLKRIETTCEKLFEAGVSVFACQKVIHPSILFTLQRKGALVLERLGKDLSDTLAVLSGAVPISDIHFQDDPDRCIGEVEEIEHIVRGQKSYLFLKNESCDEGVATILAYAAGDQEVDELKVVIHQSLQSLCHLISYPFVLPGAGCLEVWLAEELLLAVLPDLDKYCLEYECSKIEILTVVRWFRNTLLNVFYRRIKDVSEIKWSPWWRKAWNTSAYHQCVLGHEIMEGASGPITIMDSVYHHCWQKAGATICNCGLINRNCCKNFEVEWKDVEIDDIEERLGNLLPQRRWEYVNVGKESCKVTPELNFLNESHIDIMSSKLNAFNLALETCQTILNIGTVVY